MVITAPWGCALRSAALQHNLIELSAIEREICSTDQNSLGVHSEELLDAFSL